MKHLLKNALMLVFGMLLIGIGMPGQVAMAQYGVSSASVSSARANANSGGSIAAAHGYYGSNTYPSRHAAIGYKMPQPELFRVEEFINYHRHDLPLPDDGNRVRLDFQHQRVGKGKSVLQFGITTPRQLARDKIQGLNLVIVVDESGSMRGEKTENLKKALRKMVEQFRKTDRVAIVGFSNSARVILPATEKTNAARISSAINLICADGGTNLHAGLMCGYQEANRSFDARRANRVIFLTDGNANVGVTESQEIARQSDRCSERGISLVTIGLGVNFNNGLLRELSDSGRSVMHFINDSRDIQKTFVKEVESLLSPAAQNVRLTIKFDGLEKSPKFYGYEERIKKKEDGRFVFQLDDLNHGATQVVLARLAGDQVLRGEATLSYRDAITKQLVQQRCKLNPDHEKLDSQSVSRNYAIALVAQSMRTASEESNNGNCAKAEKKLKNGIEKASAQCQPDDDKHVRRIVKIAKQYLNEVSASQSRLANRD